MTPLSKFLLAVGLKDLTAGVDKWVVTVGDSTILATASVLVVEDAPEFRLLMEGPLRSAGYEVKLVENGSSALQVVEQQHFDVIVLDLTLPDMDGVELCYQLRATVDSFIIMVTGRSDETDKLVGLAVGADDYMTKPFSVKELVARIGVLLRRQTRGSAPLQKRALQELHVDQNTRTVSVNGEDVALTRTEFDLLASLYDEPNKVFPRIELIQKIWGSNWVGDDHMVDVHIANLRKKIDTAEVKHITTVRGVGFRLASAE